MSTSRALRFRNVVRGGCWEDLSRAAAYYSYTDPGRCARFLSLRFARRAT